MYKNASEKLMKVLEIVTGLGMAGCIIMGIFVMVSNGMSADGMFAGLLVAVIGCLLVWISGLITATLAEIGINVAKLSAPKTPLPLLDNTPTPVNKPIPGGWTCTCGRNNANYVSTCPCGTNRREIN